MKLVYPCLVHHHVQVVQLAAVSHQVKAVLGAPQDVFRQGKRGKAGF